MSSGSPRGTRDGANDLDRGLVRREWAVNALRVTETILGAGSTVELESERTASISILICGSLQLESGDRSVLLEDAGAVTRPVGCRQLLTVGTREARLVDLHLEASSPARHPPIRRQVHAIDPRLTVLGLALLSELCLGDAAAAFTSRMLIRKVLATISDLMENGPSRPEPPAWMIRAAAMLRHSAHRSEQVAVLARRLGVHRVTLARDFRRHFGVRPSAYMRSVRLAKALRALSFGQQTPSQAAQAAGFFDQSHLSRWLRREAGTTPARMIRTPSAVGLPVIRGRGRGVSCYLLETARN